MREYEKDGITLLDEEAGAVQEQHFADLLLRLEVHASDREVFEDFFRLLDKRNRGITNIQHVLVLCASVTSKTIPDLFQASLKLLDRANSKMILKGDLLIICKLLNEVCFYVGDKALPVEQVSPPPPLPASLTNLWSRSMTS